MILYHGTNTYFEEFSNDSLSTEDSIDQYGSGFYFYDEPGKTTMHGGLRITAEVIINKIEEWSNCRNDIPKDLAEDLILSSPDLDDRLENYGDIDYEGYEEVLEKAIKAYSGYTDYVSLLNVIGNDFYDRKDTHLLLKKFVKITGIDCIKDSERGIYVILTKQQIRIDSVVHEQEWEDELNGNV